MKSANYAPVYCALYPEFAEIARAHGYAMAVHGSLARDFDLICIPWADTVSHPEAVIKNLLAKFALRRIGELTPMKHGRVAQTICIKHGECALDLSFMPIALPTISGESK